MTEPSRAAGSFNPQLLDVGEPAGRLEPAAVSSTVRPRNRRLVSTEQELVSTSGTSTPSRSRAVSPIPSKHPSRSSTRGSKNGRPLGGLLASPTGNRVDNGASSPVSFGGIWEGGWMSSWSALQGIASSVLAGDIEGEGGLASGNFKSLGRKGGKRVSSARQMPEIWGPLGPSQQKGGIGTGTLEERDAAVKMRKKAGILEGREEVGGTVDPNGNFKRRTSFEETRPDGEDDDRGDSLVYIHHVQPQDTLAGVILKYNCQPAVFKKANRFWPNDSIQTRKVVVLPTDACAIKGRPCEPPPSDAPHQGVDLLATTPGRDDPPIFTNGSSWLSPSPKQTEASAEHLATEDEHLWTHVRWVLIDSSPSSKPVEIGRIPRKTLGYFPSRRRKSQTTISTASTPRASSEFPRLSQSISQLPAENQISSRTSTPARRTSNLGPRPLQPIIGSYFPRSRSSSRPSREIAGDAADRLGWMSGPGGVGTLGKNVRRPGPAQDGLNSWANKHLPGLAIDSLPSTSLLSSDSARFGFGEDLPSIAEGASGTSNNQHLTLEGAGQGMALENTAAAIEGWIRRLAKGPGTPKLGRVRAESTDLIELLDGTGSDDGRGFELSPGSVRSTPIGISGSFRDDINGLFNGRASTGAKGGKSD